MRMNIKQLAIASCFFYIFIAKSKFFLQLS
jgi:hypothetical protein